MTMKSQLIPAISYRDCVRMIDWLCDAFGFKKNAVYMESDDTVAHAQLTLGDGMVMLSSYQKQGEMRSSFAMPDEVGGRETQTCCVITEDCDGVYASAKAAGAKMILDLKEQDYGGKSFSCADPEGHIWHVGSYNPWA
ncbi:VOC family protein [Terriglobus saanensis]|uniref:Glyoxalase/bleomycin resistance protein/dioxygenase n=1 Tax=Terriglobus saanensis (strain ATCC BAA-1853 / DSM 23119 / SP1PR4) TaxID=401053 RepID=E8UZ36_TERSS|nr:VOC family protein [Terriglobus saanensis]ADV80981.1 Glyoxalase/bleomycin resistance protein/dioxygenase [Terriglobus saanensis SP1PR4]